MALPIRVNFENPFIDIHTGRGQGSCIFAKWIRLHLFMRRYRTRPITQNGPYSRKQ